MTAIGRVTHQLRWAVNGNTALNANGFAEFTADAFFLIHNSDFEKLRVIRARLHGNTVKGANIHTEFASRTGFGIHFGFRNS